MRLPLGQLLGPLLALLLLLAPPWARASEEDVIAAVQVLRTGGCGGIVPAAPPLRHEIALDRAAAQWASGIAAAAAVHRNGYTADTLSGLHLTGAGSSLVQRLARTHCRTVTDRALQDLGVYQRGLETWLILTSRYTFKTPEGSAVKAAAASGHATGLAPPVAAARSAPALGTSSFAARVLELVNDVRARGTLCGERSFAPAPPVRLSRILNDVALGHAADMARHDYFEHEDLSGHSPAERVRAVGYAEKLVGENIAYGPQSADEVVRGWVDSPGHCENIMDPRFAEMGIAYSPGRDARRGLYWVQLLVAPKA